ncbi:DUF2789 domain-containing protein [Propionivibrio sp.]|uniref:DUF2789 domain-containing protein n=1 Tax=Propionivibrio sp. TaxID=2212460 RepID=UPI003BF125C0
MENAIHKLGDLFRQLGLPDDPASIEDFITCHRPLPPEVHVAEAAFWTPSQALFLRDQINDDADWAELVDSLAVLLSR